METVEMEVGEYHRPAGGFPDEILVVGSDGCTAPSGTMWQYLVCSAALEH